MTNFEFIDNLLQACTLLLCAVCSGVLAWKKHEPRLIVLASAYFSWTLGTAFYMLHLLIRGETPQVFCVSEISWISSYLFFLTLCIMRVTKDERHSFPLVAFGPAVLICVPSTIFSILYGFSFIGLLWNSSMSAVGFFAVRKLVFSHSKKNRVCGFGMVLLLILFVQRLLLISSYFISDFTCFNLYFAIDFTLTGMLICLLPLLYREVNN